MTEKQYVVNTYNMLLSCSYQQKIFLMDVDAVGHTDESWNSSESIKYLK